MTIDNEAFGATGEPRGQRTKQARTDATAEATPRKSEAAIKMLLRSKGATSLDLIATTGWTCNGFVPVT